MCENGGNRDGGLKAVREGDARHQCAQERRAEGSQSEEAVQRHFCYMVVLYHTPGTILVVSTIANNSDRKEGYIGLCGNGCHRLLRISGDLFVPTGLRKLHRTRRVPDYNAAQFGRPTHRGESGDVFV
jgi:hypothetical protein